MVYVSGLMFRDRVGGPVRWAALWSCPGDVDELHGIAAAIGLKRSWFREHLVYPHYYVTAGRQASAIRVGAVPTDFKAWVKGLSGEDRFLSSVRICFR